MSEVLTSHPLNAHAPWTALAHDVTPTEGFYCRNHAEFPRPFQTFRWGRRELPIEALRELPQTEVTVTLECAGNGRTGFQPLPKGTPWGIRGLSTGRFSGVRLRDMLEAYPPLGEYHHMIFQGADSDSHGFYARSLTIYELAYLDPLLALDMNGEPLLLRHGAPLRLIVPGYFAMASVKWLDTVRFSETPCEGYYQAMDYLFMPRHETGLPTRAVTWMLPKSLITSPATATTVGPSLLVQGKAWSGRSPIVGVRLQVDGASVEANLGPYLGNGAWRSFEASLELSPGEHSIEAYARSEDGLEQPTQAPWNQQGYENNSAHVVHVTV